MHSLYKSTTILSFLILTFLFYSCGANRRLYTNKDDGQISHGILNDSSYIAIKSFCQQYSSVQVNDTIIIKYDFNHENCWNTLDMTEESRIRNVIDSYNASIDNEKSNRPGISIFQFREAGNAFNKYKKWNTEIKIDSSGVLGNILFSQRVVCGSSAIILPDKRFVIIRSDSHLEALRYTSEMIKAILDIKNN